MLISMRRPCLWRFAMRPKVLPTVVTVETTTKPRPSQGGPLRRPPFQQNPFGDLFEDQIPGFGEPGAPPGT